MDLLSDALLVTGGAWFVLAGLGVARLGDTLARVHAATKATTFGLGLVILGAALQAPAFASVKLVLALLLVAVTAPVGGHLLGRAVEANPGTAELRIDVRAAAEADPDELDR